MMANLLVVIYIAIVGVLSIYGFLGFLTFILFWRYKNQKDIAPLVDSAVLPEVTIQLPIYNERFVIERLIDSAVRINYPRDRLQIQVIDDSDDETTAIAAARIAQYQAEGIAIEHVRRSDRSGYKAGALAAALANARGEYIAIFDADFLPMPDFLMDTVPYFVDNPLLGMVQARWGHLNDSESALTAAQSIALDKHFVMEQNVRNRANMFPKFNGSAGIWRQTCVDDAGGWRADTVCEDLCLSTRATLKGWEFRYLGDVVAPAELPGGIRAYKNQQARWAKGSIQCLQKYGQDIMRDANHTLTGRLYALLTMSAYGTHILLLLLLILQLPMILLDVSLPPFMVLFTFVGIGQPLLFIVAQKETYPDWGKRILYFPTLLIIAIGMAPSSAKAVLEAFQGNKHHPFKRTPKGYSIQASADHWQRFYRLPDDGSLWMELLLAAYVALSLALAAVHGQFGSVILLLTSLLGFTYVAYLEIRETWTRQAKPSTP
ncbi:MAG: glycosyltransferase [Candidatus Promineifilaceae bacterium]|jgi:cellulose synthase/poly-beta-1,6-N-acetylglucosamine synthase-like glycosyltransferase